RADDDARRGLAAWGVVPRREDAAKQGVVGGCPARWIRILVHVPKKLRVLTPNLVRVAHEGPLVRGKLDGRVEPDVLRPDLVERVNVAEEQIADPGLDALLAPDVRRRPGVRQEERAVDEKERFALDADVPRVGEGVEQSADERSIVLGRVLLRHE